MKRNYGMLVLLAALPLPGCSFDLFPDRGSYCTQYPTSDVCGGRSIYADASVTRDLLTYVSRLDEEWTENSARQFTQTFALSDEQGLRLAQAVRDFRLLQGRTEADLAEFAHRTYGLHPGEIVEAVRQAQLGQREELNQLLDQAARHFGTDTQTMRRIVRALHGVALAEQGVEL